jgi:hypothetical protein
MADRRGFGPERERKCVAREAEPPARDCQLSVAANAETASLKSAERERARRWFATDWQVKEAAKAGARAARRWQRKEKCARGQTVAGDSRQCGEPSNPARKRVRPRTAERDRARTGLHGRLGIRAVDLSTKPQTGNENTTPGDGLPEARPFRDRTKNSRGVPRAP